MNEKEIRGLAKDNGIPNSHNTGIEKLIKKLADKDIEVEIPVEEDIPVEEIEEKIIEALPIISTEFEYEETDNLNQSDQLQKDGWEVYGIIGLVHKLRKTKNG